MPRSRRGSPPARSKASSEYLHAKRRALERYGLALNKEMYLGLCADIQNGLGVCLGKQSNTRTVWKIKAPTVNDFGFQDHIACNVVYDKSRHRIVTFLPVGIVDAKGVPIEPEIEGDSL